MTSPSFNENSPLSPYMALRNIEQRTAIVVVSTRLFARSADLKPGYDTALAIANYEKEGLDENALVESVVLLVKQAFNAPPIASKAETVKEARDQALAVGVSREDAHRAIVVGVIKGVEMAWYKSTPEKSSPASLDPAIVMVVTDRLLETVVQAMNASPEFAVDSGSIGR